MVNLEPLTLLIHLAIFLVMVFGILNPLLFKPMLRVMDERKNRIDGNRHAAEQAGKKAEELMAEYSRVLEEARKEAVKEKEAIRKTAAAEEDRIIRSARGKAGDMIADLRERIAGEYREAQSMLSAESQARGREIAARLLGRAI